MKKEEKIEKKVENFLNRKLTRREFIKKSMIGIGALALGAYTLNNYFIKRADTTFSGIFRKDAPTELWKWSKESYFYDVLDKNTVQCKTCPHKCVLGLNDRGRCRTRVNLQNKLYNVAYGNPCSMHIDPIEKKPFFHFLPGTSAFSISTAGCNFRCLYCQNWEIAQFRPEDTNNVDFMPDRLVGAALYAKQQNPSVKSIAYTYGEPVAFYEYMLDTAKLAKVNGMKNVIITNGYLNEEPINKLNKYLDAVKIDFKGFSERFYKKVIQADLDENLKSIKNYYKTANFLELVVLIVPTLNDDMDEIKAMTEWAKDNLSKDVPIHFSRFHPDYKLKNLPPTPMETLKKAREIAMDVGMNYVYIGNVPHGDYENTYCPKEKHICIERIGYVIKQYNIKDGKCTICGEKIAGVWEA